RLQCHRAVAWAGWTSEPAICCRQHPPARATLGRVFFTTRFAPSRRFVPYPWRGRPPRLLRSIRLLMLLPVSLILLTLSFSLGFAVVPVVFRPQYLITYRGMCACCTRSSLFGRSMAEPR